MEFFHKVLSKSGWSIIYIEVIISKKYCISLKNNFVPANSAEPDEMHYGTFATSFSISSGSSLFANVPV